MTTYICIIQYYICIDKNRRRAVHIDIERRNISVFKCMFAPDHHISSTITHKSHPKVRPNRNQIHGHRIDKRYGVCPTQDIYSHICYIHHAHQCSYEQVWVWDVWYLAFKRFCSCVVALLFTQHKYLRCSAMLCRGFVVCSYFFYYYYFVRRCVVENQTDINNIICLSYVRTYAACVCCLSVFWAHSTECVMEELRAVLPEGTCGAHQCVRALSVRVQCGVIVFWFSARDNVRQCSECVCSVLARLTVSLTFYLTDKQIHETSMVSA